jgi:hypothetical protein
MSTTGLLKDLTERQTTLGEDMSTTGLLKDLTERQTTLGEDMSTTGLLQDLGEHSQKSYTVILYLKRP